MSCKAAILVLFNFSSARKGEEAAAARDLRCQLVDILVNVAPTSESLQQQANRDSSAYPCPTVSGPPAHLLEPTTPVNSTVPGPPAHLLESTTPANSTVPGPPAHLLEPTTPVNSTVPGPPAHLLELTTPVNSTVPGPPACLLELTTPVNSTVPGPPAHLLESTTPANSTVPGPPAHLLEPTTPVNSTVPGPPAHLLELTTPVNSTVPGPPACLLEPITTPLKSKWIATEDLLSRQQAVRNKQDGGRKFTSREVARRLNLQKDELTKLAKNVHHGSKNDFIASLAESVTSKKDHGNNNWDGTLSPQDVVNLAIRALRRRLPRFFDSERKVNSLKAKFRREFEVVWKPERTHSGWRINPDRLRETLLHLYWWLPPIQWWKIYGDGRNFGGNDSVALTLNVLNNEAMFHGFSYHSPDEYWPLYIFYGKDTRLNLELNLGDPVKPDSLNAWTDSMMTRGHQIFISCDSKFSDNLLGGGLDSTSTDSFNMYNYETKETRSDVGNSTGFRSEVGRTIEREHPESLLPSLPTSCYIPDTNHCFCRTTEHMVFDRCMSCMNLKASRVWGGRLLKTRL